MTTTTNIVGRRATRRWAFLVGVALTVTWLGTSETVADRYEASVSLRPLGAMGRITENVDGAERAAIAAAAYGGGGGIGVAYGLRNWLNIDGEVLGAGFASAAYDPATVMITGSPTMGRLVRTTRLAQLRAGTTLRLGVAWVPTVHLGLGIGGRTRTAATLRDAEHNTTFDVTPDGMNASVALDFVAIAGVGFEHRLDERWSVGVHVEAAHAIGFGSPPLDLFSAGFSVAYTWYPRWLW
jgi:hypothetical protein